MTTTFIRILVSIGAAYVLFTHLNIEAHPSEPTLQDWVGTHEAYPVTEALVSDPTVDEGVRRLARELYAIPKLTIGGIERSIFDVPETNSYFSGRKLSIQLYSPDQPEAMWMLERVLGGYANQMDFYDCYHNGMIEDLPVDGRLILTFDVVDRHVRVLQRRTDGVYLDEIGDCVEGYLDGLELADGINELVTVELTYGEEV